jgi:membrane protein DedA with SNARE-associated domain
MLSLENFLHNVSDSPAQWLYLILFASCLVENLFPPYPGDTVILLAGYMTGVGRMHPAAALLTSVAGSLAGASVLFFLGAYGGRAIFRQGRFRFLSTDRLSQVEGWFARRGKRVVLASRFLPGVRSLVAAAAGIGRMKTSIFLIFSLISILAWNGLLMFLGFRLGRHWTAMVHWFRIYNWIIVILVVLVVLGWYIRRWGLFQPDRIDHQRGKESS